MPAVLLLRWSQSREWVLTPESHTSARLRILLTALLFSTGGAGVKACAMTSWQVASLRSGIAAVAVLLMMPQARRGWNPRSFLVATVYAATMILFVTANKLTTAASTIFLQATAPLYILLLGPLFLKEPLRRTDIGFLAALAAGLVMLLLGVDAPAATAPHPFAGNVCAAASGLCWALTVTGLRWMGKGGAGDEPGGSAAPAIAIGNIIAFAACLPWALPLRGSSTTDWAIVLYLGVFQIGLAYALLTSGIRHVPALETSLLLYLEPVLNPVWAWVFQGESPGRWSVIGGALIITATALKTWRDYREGSL